MVAASFLPAAALIAHTVFAAPTSFHKRQAANVSYYDVQGHRGARGEAVESTLAAFAHGLLSGVTTLEMDNGITADGHVIVWHDEIIDATKCQDTGPAAPNDSQYPYVGKHLANLTLAQIKTLDCGSLRLAGFPLQLTYPGHKLSTLPELFDFVACTGADDVMFNIESKVNPIETNSTRAPEVFVQQQLAVFQNYSLIERIEYQSFDWRTIIQSKQRLPQLRTSALADDTTIYARASDLAATSGASDWLAGLDLASFNGSDDGARLAQAAASIGADVLSPSGLAYNGNLTLLDPTFPGYRSFVNASMVDTAQSLGLTVKPWTVNRLNTVEQIVDLGVDGIITDFMSFLIRVTAVLKSPLACYCASLRTAKGSACCASPKL